MLHTGFRPPGGLRQKWAGGGKQAKRGKEVQKRGAVRNGTCLNRQKPETGPEPPETGPEPPETGPEFGNRDLNPRNGARFSRPVSNGPFLRFSQAGYP